MSIDMTIEANLDTVAFAKWIHSRKAQLKAIGVKCTLIVLPEAMERLIDEAYVKGRMTELVSHKPDSKGSLRTYLDGTKVRFIKTMDIRNTLWVLEDLKEDSQ